MVAAIAVNATLHRVNQQSALDGGIRHQSAEIKGRGERLFGRLIGNELDCPEQSDATNFADGIQATKRIQVLFERGRDAAGTI